jgi:3-deoxy-D-manno-octulosonate 8-phosphate phosphatase (KDO 8-P phosphatase)
MNFPIEKAKPIRLLILDVDGILTSGHLYYGPQTVELKAFHIHDGLGIKLLQQQGIPVAIISGKTSEALSKRLADLQIKHVYLSCEEKLSAYQALKQQLQCNDHEIAYMGDDLPDLPILHRVGLSITVPNAPAVIQQHAHYLTQKNAGEGAVREICDLILASQNKLQTIIDTYLT